MEFFLCPICKQHFSRRDHSLVCPEGHSFDIARRGYVNLLRPGKVGAVRHGDDRLMVDARRAFLDAGFYAPLRDAVTDIVCAMAPSGSAITVLDAGCGEGYYTAAVKRALESMGTAVSAYGIDVSRDALNACAVRDRAIRLAVASIFDLPAENESVDVLLNLFAPYDAAEFARVLKMGGTLVRAFPRERHLWDLKAAIYDEPYENEILSTELDGFAKVTETALDFPLHLETSEQIMNLFRMTPYYYKTSREGQARAQALPKLETHASFRLLVYQKVKK